MIVGATPHILWSYKARRKMEKTWLSFAALHLIDIQVRSAYTSFVKKQFFINNGVRRRRCADSPGR